MKTNFLEAFTAPLKEPRGIGKLLFGGFLMILSSILMLNWGEFFKLGKDYEYIFSILFLIGFLIQFIPFGYCIKSAHECIQDEFLIMPEWSDIGEYLARGIISAIILFIYAIPFFILALLGGFFIVTFGTNPLLIYLLLFFVSCIEVMIISTVLMFYFKDMKFTDAFRLVAIFKVFCRNIKTIFIIFLHLFCLAMFSAVLIVASAITIIGILLIPSISFLSTIASFYIIAKEGREILWNENMWGVDDESEE